MLKPKYRTQITERKQQVSNTFVRQEEKRLEKPISNIGKARRNFSMKASQKLDAKHVGV